MPMSDLDLSLSIFLELFEDNGIYSKCMEEFLFKESIFGLVFYKIFNIS